MATICENITTLRMHMPQNVNLVCVSKFHPVESIRQAYEVGERHFGESRVQELLAKLPQLPADIYWHFIGHLQTNKVLDLLKAFYSSASLRNGENGRLLIESVDSKRLLRTINDTAARLGVTQDVLLEVHVAQEETKTGFSPDEIIDLLPEITNHAYPHIRLCGLMAMATNTDDEVEIRRCFTAAQALFCRLRPSLAAPVLSMGMSDDYETAIACGSTSIRIGSAIFGERDYGLSKDTRTLPKAVFFDMDGVLFNSMPFHARAWREAMDAHGLPFSEMDAYRNEGRTGAAVIEEALEITGRNHAGEDLKALIASIYADKSARFNAMCPNGAEPIPGIREVLGWLRTNSIECWVVTGSGQRSLLEKLNRAFPQAFSIDRIISSYDVTHGKPAPEPYLKALERSGRRKEECWVVENAPLGVQAGKAAGLFTIAVNTGILPDEVLREAGADRIFKSMDELLGFLHRAKG